MKKKIAIVNSSLDRGGLTKVIYNISKFLNKENFEIKIFTFTPHGINSEVQLFSNENIEVKCIGSGKGLIDLLRNFRKEIKMYNPDLIHTHSFRGSFLSALFIRKVKHLATIHGNLEDNHVATYGYIRGKMFSVLEVSGFKFAHYQSVVSSTLSFYLNRNSKGKVIENGIDLDQYFPLSLDEKIQRRLDLGIEKGKKVLVTHSGIIERKNLRFLIEGFIKSNGDDKYLLLIVGTGVLANELKTLTKSRSDVRWVGFVENPAYYLQIGDYYISASLSEGMPNSGIEAIECGLYPVVSNIPSHKELIEISGVPHQFFSPFDLNDLVEVLKGLPDPISSKSKFDFGVEKMAKEYENYYLEIINS